MLATTIHNGKDATDGAIFSSGGPGYPMKSIALFFVAMSVSSVSLGDIMTFDYSITLSGTAVFPTAADSMGNNVTKADGLEVESPSNVDFAQISIVTGSNFLDFSIKMLGGFGTVPAGWAVSISDFRLTGGMTASITSLTFNSGASLAGAGPATDPGAVFAANSLTFTTGAVAVGPAGTLNYRFDVTEFNSAAVPEPSSFAALVVGGGLLVSSRRRKDKSRVVDQAA